MRCFDVVFVANVWSDRLLVDSCFRLMWDIAEPLFKSTEASPARVEFRDDPWELSWSDVQALVKQLGVVRVLVIPACLPFHIQCVVLEARMKVLPYDS